MSLAQLRLEVGESIQLQLLLPNATERYGVRVVGYLHGHSLIVTAPQNKGRVLLVREGQRLAVRMLLGGSVCGYVAKVLRTRTEPYPYLHLSYPSDMESIVVRNAPRESICIPASARNAKEPRVEASWQSVELLDLSSTGARFAAKEAFADVNDMLELQMHLAVNDLDEEELSVAADIRNRTGPEKSGKMGEELYRYGVEFRALNNYQKLLIYSFVLECSMSREVIED